MERIENGDSDLTVKHKQYSQKSWIQKIINDEIVENTFSYTNLASIMAKRDSLILSWIFRYFHFYLFIQKRNKITTYTSWLWAKT